MFYIPEERKQERSGGVLKATTRNADVTSTHIRSGRTQSHSSLKARKHVAFLYEHVGLSLPQMRVQRERSGEGTENMEKQPLYIGIIDIALVN